MGHDPRVLVEGQTIHERCNDGGLASGANGPSPAQSGAIAAIEAWPTIGGSCTCFQNLAISIKACGGRGEEEGEEEWGKDGRG